MDTEEKGAELADGSHSEAEEADPDFVPEADTESVLEEDADYLPAAQRAQRRQNIKVETTIPSPAPFNHAASCPTSFYQPPSYPAPIYQPPSCPAPIYQAPHYVAPFYQAPPDLASFYQAQPYSALSLSDILLTATAIPNQQPSLPVGRHFTDPIVDSAEEIFELEEGETVLDLVVGPLSETVLQRTS